MAWLQSLQLEKFLLFALVLTRVSGLTATAPIYGTKEVPMQVRALFAVALALLITPSQWHVPVDHPGNLVNFLVLIAGELLIGMCLGIGVVILFSGVELAGQMIGRTGGLALAEVYDPAMDASVPTFSRMLLLVTMAVFVCIGGHRAVMGGLLDTFKAIPPGGDPMLGSVLPEWMPVETDRLPLGVQAMVELVSQSFHLGIRAAMPVVTALLLSTLIMGLISRTMPQFNILMVGFGMNAMLTFAIFSLTIGAAAWIVRDWFLQESLHPALESLLQTIGVGWPLRGIS